MSPCPMDTELTQVTSVCGAEAEKCLMLTFKKIHNNTLVDLWNDAEA